MMRQRRWARLHADESGFSLIELLVATVMIGILAAIALALFLNQADKGKDASMKSAVNNLARLVQQCRASNDTDDFRECDSESEIGDTSFNMDPTPADNSAPCDDGDPGAVGSGQVRVAIADVSCFVVVGVADSGNKFWYVKHDDSTTFRDCTTHGVNGCPTDGEWAG